MVLVNIFKTAFETSFFFQLSQEVFICLFCQDSHETISIFMQTLKLCEEVYQNIIYFFSRVIHKIAKSLYERSIMLKIPANTSICMLTYLVISRHILTLLLFLKFK